MLRSYYFNKNQDINMKFSDNTLKSTTKLLMVVMALFISFSTSAQVWHWNGSDNSDYDNPANWDSGTAPPDGVDVYIHGDSDHEELPRLHSATSGVLQMVELSISVLYISSAPRKVTR